jgi:hypothetical protein
MNKNELISVIDVAKEAGKIRQTIFKKLKRLGIEPIKQRSSSAKGQLISYITKKEAKYVLSEINNASTNSEVDSLIKNPATGVFYIIQLEPEYDSGRFKVGFTSSIEERMRTHRCSAPYAEVLKTWPCKLLWEKTIIEAVCKNCEQIHTEVFRTNEISDVISSCNKIFELMPIINK